MPAIEVLVNAHNEGALLMKTLESVQAAVEVSSKSHGVSCQVTVILDSPDPKTTAIAEKALGLGSHVRISRVEYRDLGLSRNHGISESVADYIAFVDADDLWGPNWLKLAFSSANLNHGSIFHPEISYYFGSSLTREANIISRHISSTDENFDIFTLATENYWTSACFAAREVFHETPYRAVDKTKRIGMEDWTFNLETLGKGVEHLVVENAVHFIRNKPLGSMRDDHAGYGAFHYPVKYI